ncbi:hypothetical protein PROFUN_10583 [Planoprotostelium fungivorum]|uniref:Uncharacterized protein n=1 Tax=Planoprotostelium fungivorum TaxID=1890364 RepID=A0A2P6ND00_9EUKA|nr:hypothetical protein PROFUN_10583 [Planoprotostelium fungivorum]
MRANRCCRHTFEKVHLTTTPSTPPSTTFGIPLGNLSVSLLPLLPSSPSKYFRRDKRIVSGVLLAKPKVPSFICSSAPSI